MNKLSDYVMKFIAGLGVDHVFTLVGGGAMHLIDSLGRNRDLKYICCLHEQACAIAAEAYSQYTNNIGVAVVTTGPGGTNTITGVAGAWLDSIPVLFISGQVKRNDIAGPRCVRQMGFQEIDIVSMVRPITKYAVTIKDPNSIRYHLEIAAHMAISDRPGPVWIDIPLDVQAAMIDENQLWGLGLSETVPDAGSDVVSDQILRSIEALNRSERPVILAGNGIRLSGALNEFREFIEELKIPVLTTWKAIDFMAEDHSLYAGRPGAVGQRGANFAQQNSDWLLSIGARLDLGQTAYTHKYFARAAYKTIVDIDVNEINKLQMAIDSPVHADARVFIREFMRNRHKIVRKDRSAWYAKIKEWRLRYPVILPEYWEEKDCVNDYVLIDVLSDEMSSSDLFVPGSSGACSERSMQAFRVKDGMRIFNTEGLGSMGFGVPAALGGCVASGGKNTVCIEGDGGFAMNIQDLETVRRLNLPIKFFVLNNQGYGSIINTQKNYFNGNYVGSTKESGLTLPDFKTVGAAFGIAVSHIRNHEQIREHVREVLQHDGPVICEVTVSAEQQTAPRVTSRQTSDGSMVSMPMEDMWPFLDREEFRANMIVPPLMEE
jgi:acetolactate synthase I/II/III large subunit